jgi:hypothetical protein
MPDMRLIIAFMATVFLAACTSTPQESSVRQREANYRQTLAMLGDGATRGQLQRAFPKMRRLSPPRSPEDGSVLTGTEHFRVDADFVLQVKFMYAAPYRIAADATRLGAQAAADVPPSAWQIFGFVRQVSRGPYADSPHDEVLSTRLVRGHSR